MAGGSTCIARRRTGNTPRSPSSAIGADKPARPAETVRAAYPRSSLPLSAEYREAQYPGRRAGFSDCSQAGVMLQWTAPQRSTPCSTLLAEEVSTMPLFEFRCNGCHAEFEALCRDTRADGLTCPTWSGGPFPSHLPVRRQPPTQPVRHTRLRTARDRMRLQPDGRRLRPLRRIAPR